MRFTPVPGRMRLTPVAGVRWPHARNNGQHFNTQLTDRQISSLAVLSVVQQDVIDVGAHSVGDIEACCYSREEMLCDTTVLDVRFLRWWTRFCRLWTGGRPLQRKPQ